MIAVVSPRIHLDCCALLNLYATRRFIEVLTAHVSARGTYFVVADYVMQKEALWVGAGSRAEPGSDWELVDLTPAIDAGLVHVEHLVSAEEMATFVALAKNLDDGEAATGALAAHHGGAVATDDAQAIRVLSALVPPVPVLRTTELVKGWADANGIDGTAVRQALLDIRQRSRFEPGARDPLVSWWRTVMGAPPRAANEPSASATVGPGREAVSAP